MYLEKGKAWDRHQQQPKSSELISHDWKQKKSMIMTDTRPLEKVRNANKMKNNLPGLIQGDD